MQSRNDPEDEPFLRRLYFEERLLQPHAQMLTAEELELGSVYFAAAFLDRQMLLPTLEPYVFIGRQLDPEGETGLYFQDFASYSSGSRYPTATKDDVAIFIHDPEATSSFFYFEDALDRLLWCSLRRQRIPAGEARSFKGRRLDANLEPIPPKGFEIGSLYFSLVFRDCERLTPALAPYVFLGKDLRPGDSGRLYFQDVASRRRGVRFEDDTEVDDARFLAEYEAEANHFLDYEHALEELMRCSVRRRERGIAPQRSKGEARDVALEVPQLRTFRFEDPELQQALITSLRDKSVTFDVRGDGTVVYANSDARSVGQVASSIQDSHFRGYFLCWGDDRRTAQLFEQRLKDLKLQYLAQSLDGELTFFLPQAREELYDSVLQDILKY